MASAVDGFGTFKAMLDQYEQAGKVNEQLQQRIDELQHKTKQLQGEKNQLQQTNEQLHDQVDQSQEEVQALRRVIEYGQQIVSKNRNRDEAMQQAFASVLAQAVQLPATPSLLKSDDSSADEEPPSTGVFADLKCEADNDTADRTKNVTSGPLAALPFDVGLVKDVGEDGTLTYCSTSEIPPLVEASITENIQEAKDSARPKTTWGRRFTKDFQCATVANYGGGCHWVDSVVGKFACRLCFVQRRACVLFDQANQKLAVLPIPPSLRAKAAMPGTDEYYITKSNTSRHGAAKDGPWSKEPTVSSLSAKKRKVAE